MINWFRQKLRNFLLHNSLNELSESTTTRIGSISIKGSKISSQGMSFTIYSASGGYVLEYSSYNEKTDRHDLALHIITSDQDLGQGIGHVITLEMLRK